MKHYFPGALTSFVFTAVHHSLYTYIRIQLSAVELIHKILLKTLSKLVHITTLMTSFAVLHQ